MTHPDLPSAALQPAAPEQAALFNPPFPNGHWLNIGAMLADVAFETELSGKFTAFGQDNVLGFPATQLVGKNLANLFIIKTALPSDAKTFGSVISTIHRQNVVWRGVVMLERADQSQGTYQILLAPKPSGDGTAGIYGLLIDLEGPELQVLSPEAERAKAMLDAQTGLWSAATFAEEAGRRFDRLDVEGLPGTLLLIGFGRTPPVGRGAVATRLAEELRDIIRPTDLLGRINTTTFALWCDGMDDLTGAERASRFCQRLPIILPGNPCISVGLVARWPGNGDDPQTLINQASQALAHADRVAQAAANAGSTEAVANGTWRVWNPKSTE